MTVQKNNGDMYEKMREAHGVKESPPPLYEMPQGEVLQMMKACLREIQELRETVNVLAPKADAYDTLRAAIRMAPGNNSVTAINVGRNTEWSLESSIKRMADAAAQREARHRAQAEAMSAGYQGGEKAPTRIPPGLQDPPPATYMPPTTPTA